MKKPLLRRIVQNDYIFTIATKIIVVLIGLVASSFSKRFLGPALEGELGYIDSLLTIVAVLANFGLYQPYPFYKRQNEPFVLEKFLNIFALQYLCYALLGIGLAWVFRNPALTAVCLIAPLQVLANQLSFTIMVEDVKYKNAIFFTSRIVNTAFIILAFFTMRPSLLIALAMIVIGDLLTIVLTTRRLRHVGNPFKADLTFLRRIYRFGLVAMITTLLLTLNYRLDELMLKWMGISGELRGFYRTGVSLAGYGWIISDAFREVLFSRTAKNDAVDDVVFSLKINAYITIFMLAGIALLGKPVIHLLFGAAYLPAYQVTVVLLFGILSMSYFKLIGTLLLAQKKIKMYVATLTASVLMNVVANLLTIPTLGILGAALSSVLSYTLAGVVFLSYFMHTYHIKAKRIFLLNRGDFAFLSRKF